MDQNSKIGEIGENSAAAKQKKKSKLHKSSHSGSLPTTTLFKHPQFEKPSFYAKIPINCDHLKLCKHVLNFKISNLVCLFSTKSSKTQPRIFLIPKYKIRDFD